jgi:hypothetical protein
MAPPIRDLISSVRAGNFLTLPNDMINMTPATQFANGPPPSAKASSRSENLVYRTFQHAQRAMAAISYRACE